MQLKKVILKKKQTYVVESLQGEGLRMKYAEMFGQKDSCQTKSEYYILCVALFIEPALF